MGNAIDQQDGELADDRPARKTVEASWRRAVRLTAPAAVGAFAAALTALESGDAGRLALGVALGAALGAATAAVLAPARQAAAAPPPASLSAVERLEQAAAEAAALIGGPTASGSEALSDAHRILERLPLALLLLDARGRIIFANPAAEREIGLRLTGEHFASALRAPALAEALREAYAGRVAAEVDFTLRRFQERRFHGVVRALEPATAGAGATAGTGERTGAGERTGTAGPEERKAEIRGHARVIVILQDQTRIRRAEQLHRDFVANASHELKTPLSSVAGFIETLRGPAKDDPEARERFLRIMAQQAERMRRLVEDLLSLNRIELNEHVPPRETLDLVALAARTAEQTPEFEQGRIQMALEEAGGPALVRGDAAQLEQVFVNLVENALKYGGDRKPIRIVATRRDAPRRQIGVTVQDFGPGIPKEHIPRLTERFYRVADRPDALKSGTGLGLSIVKHAVSRHRGQLQIESRLGQGSRFTIWLPPAEDFDGAVADR